MDKRQAALAAIEAGGGPTKVGAALGISHVAVLAWGMRGQVPATRVIDLEKLIEARVTRYEMRPDVFPR